MGQSSTVSFLEAERETYEGALLLPLLICTGCAETEAEDNPDREA